MSSFAALGYDLESALPDMEDVDFAVRLRFLRRRDDPFLVELVQPLNPTSSVSRLLARAGAGPYHVGYSVDDLAITGAELRAQGYRPVTGRKKAPALAGSDIQFFHRRDFGLVELIQWPRP